MKIKIPFIGSSTNAIYAGVNWRKRKAEADMAHLITKIACKGVPSFNKPAKLIFTPFHSPKKGCRLYDCSNYSYAAKMIEDGLVRAGVLINDNVKYIKGFYIEEPVKIKGESYMLVEIKEVS